VVPIELESRAKSLLELYRTGVRPLLEEHEVVGLDQLDRAEQVVKSALNRDPTLSVGFLGDSQVGKSSIINAMLGRWVLPAGGIGPLTAQATGVGYRDQNAFEVHYHGAERLNRVLFQIHDYLVRRGEVTWSMEAVDASLDDADEDAGDSDGSSDPEADGEDARGVSNAAENLLQSVRLMLQQDDALKSAELSRPALVDAVRMMLGRAPLGEAAPLAPVAPAIARVREKLGEHESIEEDESDRRAFIAALQLRAAGWLSPLVERLEVGFRIPFLHHLRLVDLPGLNNFADAGGSVAEEFVRRRDAGAVIIVLRNNGITAALRDLLVEVLERYGVIEKLLWGNASEKPTIQLVLAVTHLDNVAKERWRTKREEAELYGDPLPSADAIFLEAAAEMEEEIRRQFRQALDVRLASEDGSEGKRQRVEEACRALEQSLQVLCLAAPEYREIRAGGGSSFLKQEESTHLPQLIGLLRGLANERSTNREGDLTDALEELREGMELQVASIARSYEEGGGRATSGFERFRDALDDRRVTLSAHVAEAHRKAIKTLESDLHERIEELLEEAQNAGRKRLAKLTKKAEGLHWSSLNAALRRDGDWKRQNISYPQSLTKAITEEISGDWEPMVIQSVRSVMNALIKEDLALVERLCERAVELDSTMVSPEHVEEQRQILRQAMNTSVRWTRDLLDELTGEVQDALYDPILEPLKKACAKALRAGKNRGTGAKQRIIDTFQDAGKNAIDEAIGAARAVLKKNYGQVLRELRATYLKDGHDPVTAAFESLTDDEKSRARRSDAMRRRRVLDQVDGLRTALAAKPDIVEGCA
jgi:hypothetical protein